MEDVYWVVGGAYTDTDFQTIAPGNELEEYGPFYSKKEAYNEWATRSWKRVDECYVRYTVMVDIKLEVSTKDKNLIEKAAEVLCITTNEFINSILEEYMEKKKMYEYKHEMAGTAATMAILNPISEIWWVLLAKRREDSSTEPDKWSLPGGYLEVGEERVVTTATRETKEETNLDIAEDRWNLFYIDDRPGADSRYSQVINICYYATIYENEIGRLKADSDINELKWVDLFELDEDLAFDHNVIIEQLKKIIR